MPIFELDDGRPRLVQPMQPLPGSFAQDCAALLTDHLAAVAGEPLFVVRARAATHEHADVPELLALDSTGRPVVVEVVQVVDDDAVVAALRHAGTAARMTTTDLSRAYHPDPSRFAVDFAAFREQVAFGATTSRREGVRLVLLCSEVASEAGDTLGFLRGPGRHVDVLQVGVVRGVDDRRLLDISALATHETVRRSVEPTALRLVRSSEAFASAMAYDTGRVQSGARGVPAPPAPSAAGPREPGAYPPASLPTSQPAAPGGPQAPVAPAASSAPAAQYQPGGTPDLPRERTALDTAPAVSPWTELEHPLSARATGPVRVSVLGSGAPRTPAGLPAQSAPVPPAAPANPMPAVNSATLASHPAPLAQPHAPLVHAAAPTHPAPEHSVAPPDAPFASPAALHDPAAAYYPGEGYHPAPEPPFRPTSAPAVPPAAPTPAASVPAAPAAAADPTVALDRPVPELATLAKRRRAVTTLVWVRERRNQRFVAMLRHDGMIQLPDGRLHADPDDAAAAVSGALVHVDGWRSWRLGEGGPTLAEAAGMPVG